MIMESGEFIVTQESLQVQKPEDQKHRVLKAREDTRPAHREHMFSSSTLYQTQVLGGTVPTHIGEGGTSCSWLTETMRMLYRYWTSYSLVRLTRKTGQCAR